MNDTSSPGPDRERLREAIRDEYREVARRPDQGFHFHTGRRLDSFVAASVVGTSGAVIGIDMTDEMLDKGRIQIADILVHRAVSEKAKEDIDLWTG